MANTLGLRTVNAFCRAAHIDPNAAATGTNWGGVLGPGGAGGGGGGGEPTFEVQCFTPGENKTNVMVQWAGFSEATEEPACYLLQQLGCPPFKAFCRAASIAGGHYDVGLRAQRAVDCNACTVLKVWYLDHIWPDRKKLAWCFRRGTPHGGNDTTGAAENAFRQLKGKGNESTVNDKAPLATLATRQQHVEQRGRANSAGAQMLEFSQQLRWVDGVPSELLGTWTNAGLKRVAREAQQAGIGGAAKYAVWEVQPRDSRATKAWVLRRGGSRADGSEHRTRVVHAIGGALVCTCWTWEVWSIECRHCLAIHGAVTLHSAAAYWRRGTVEGINDAAIAAAARGQRGPSARQVMPHHVKPATAAERAPDWAVTITDTHAEFMAHPGGGSHSYEGGAGEVDCGRAANGPDNECGGNTRPIEGNWQAGQRIIQSAGAVAAFAASAATNPEVAQMLADGIAQSAGALMQIAFDAQRGGVENHAYGGRAGQATATTMRWPKPGAGSKARGKGHAG